MGIRENKQAFQYALPYEQVFQAAMAAVPSVPKATMMGADMNARSLTFETPLTFMSWGERIIVGFIPQAVRRSTMRQDAMTSTPFTCTMLDNASMNCLMILRLRPFCMRLGMPFVAQETSTVTPCW